MQELISIDPSFQYYRAKPLEGELKNLHMSLGYPHCHLSYINTQYTESAPIYSLSKESHTYLLSPMFINSTTSTVTEDTLIYRPSLPSNNTSINFVS